MVTNESFKESMHDMLDKVLEIESIMNEDLTDSPYLKELAELFLRIAIERGDEVARKLKAQ